MPSAHQVPVKTSHSTMRWHMWVVLIAGSTGSALRAVRPPNLHIAPDVGTISLRRECDGFLVALTLGHHGPRHPGDLISERDRGDLRWPPRQQCREPGPMFRAMDLGIAEEPSTASIPDSCIAAKDSRSITSSAGQNEKPRRSGPGFPRSLQGLICLVVKTAFRPSAAFSSIATNSPRRQATHLGREV